MRFLVLIFTVFFVSAQTAHAAGNSILDIQEVTSPGGITAWLVKDPSIPVVSMKFGFKGAGTALDPEDKQGLARMVSNTLDEGAGSLNAQAFQKELQDLVITLRFSAGRDDFGGTLKTLSKNKDRAFELLRLALTSPRFDQEAINRMRKANQSRIRSSLSDPGWMAARLLNDRAFEDHPYALNSGGTLSSLEKIKAADLEKFHDVYLGKNNLVVAVAGDIDAKELSLRLDEIFGELPEAEIPDSKKFELQNQGAVFHYQRDIPQSVIEIMQKGLNRKDPEFHTGQVMNFILGSSGFGSRLTEEIREKRGLTYGIYSYFYNLENVEALAVSTSTANKNVPEMLQVIRDEFNKIANSEVTQEELESAKSYLIGSLPLSLTSTNKIASMLNSLQLDDLPIDYLDQRKTAIQSTTIEDIQALATRLLNPESFITVIVGQPEGLEDLQTIKSLPNVE